MEREVLIETVEMFNKNSDRIVAIVPFVLVLLAGAIGMKSDVDLFDWWHLAQTSSASSNVIRYNPQGDRKNIADIVGNGELLRYLSNAPIPYCVA